MEKNAVFALLLSLIFLSCNAQFNIFKSYENVPADKRPDKYSVVSTKHDISEYLTPDQKMMMANRNGPVTDFNKMGPKWSGFDEYKSLNRIRSAVPASARVAAAAIKTASEEAFVPKVGSKTTKAEVLTKISTTTTATVAEPKKRLRTRAAPLSGSAQGIQS